ncbi:MAG: alkaline phosphatase family protein [Planctomycetaceae bacterium]|nr:alkaline phosphatase family protein [Planctomycetaceae bacterium]
MLSRAERSFPILLVLSAAIVISQGCGFPGRHGPADTFGLDLSMPPGAVVITPPAKTAGVLIFMIDGVNAYVMEDMLRAGQLPAIKKYFVDRGLYAPRAVASVPTVTLANVTSIATGMLPGHHGIVGNHWFDRSDYLYRNYETLAQKNTLDGDYANATMFEYADGRFTSAIFFQPHRGATRWYENRFSAGVAYYLGWYNLVDRVALYRFKNMAQLAREKGQWPLVTVCYLLTPDFCAYWHGVDTSHYIACMKEMDFQLGRVLGDFDRAGLLDKLTLMLVSDHGMCPVKQHCDFAKIVQENAHLTVAKRFLRESTPREQRKAYYDKYNAIIDRTGDRYMGLWLRRPRFASGQEIAFDEWRLRPSAADMAAYPTPRGRIDLFSAMMSDPCVDAIAYSVGENRIRVRTRGGEAEFAQPGGPRADISYRLVSGSDPFMWNGKVRQDMLDGTPAGPLTWLDETEHTPFPAFVSSLLAFMGEKNRRPDIVVFAAPLRDFSTTLHSGHGGLRACETYIPIMAAGGGIPHRKASTVRSVDLVPTILQLLGKPIPPDMDGRSLLESNPYHEAQRRPPSPATRPAATRAVSTAP